MSERMSPTLLPYSLLVGQERLKLALELTYVAPRIGGVLISGHRGTGKSTAVRSFAWMLYQKLPVTLPINATDDRVVGGWRMDELMIHSRPVRQPGLLEQATKTGVLYIDEVNLLDDHIVNLILDAASTGQLPLQREGMAEDLQVAFSLIGTMNPEEGYLRPQLLDRFGLMVDVRALIDREQRRQILQTVLDFDDARARTDGETDLLRDGRRTDEQLAEKLLTARDNLHAVEVPENIALLCARLAERFQAAGHRGDYVMALAARAHAALDELEVVEPKHVAAVARLALQHRRSSSAEGGQMTWTEADDDAIAEVIAESPDDA
jgi:magnesium chelatase subunit I